MGRAGDFPTANQTADQFAGSLRAGITYRIPTSWSPEPPAPDDLAARARRHAYTHPESRHIIEELLDEVEMLRHSVDVATDAAPVPPWPGAVLSGLTDEDGVPTWLAQAGQVRGEQVRACTSVPWLPNTSYGEDEWVEVRAPRAVPEPETERVPWWEAVGRRWPDGRTVWKVTHSVEGVIAWDNGGEALDVMFSADGTVEVLKDGDR